MANVQDSRDDKSSDDDDDDEDEEKDPMEESHVNLVGNTIKELAPAAQVLPSARSSSSLSRGRGAKRGEKESKRHHGSTQQQNTKVHVPCGNSLNPTVD